MAIRYGKTLKGNIGGGGVINEIFTAKNLVYNYDFRYFSNQASVISAWYDYMHPDGYIYSDNGTDGKTGYDTALKCCKIMTSTNGSGTRIFKQALHEFVNWRETLRGSTVTLKALVKGNATVKLTDGVDVISHTLQNTGAIEDVELQIEVSNAATELTFSIESSISANVIEVYKVYANKGHEAVEALPCMIQGVIGEIKTYDSTETPPAGEFELNGIELPDGYSRLGSLINGKFGKGTNGRSKLSDMRGLFERVWAHGSGNDPDRASRTNRGDGVAGDRVGTKQEDAIRNITGYIGDIRSTSGNPNSSGVLRWVSPSGSSRQADGIFGVGFDLNFEAARSVPTGSDNRPKNITVLKTIRWC